MTIAPRLSIRTLLLMATVIVGTAFADDAAAINQMRVCAGFTTSYADVRPGQDYLITSTNAAKRHRAMLWAYSAASGYIIFNGYLDENGCTPLLGISVQFHEFWVTNRQKVAVDKDILVYNNAAEVDVWHGETITTPANPTGDSQFTSIFTGTLADHVSLVATRVSASSMVVPPNAPYVEYRIYANRVYTGTDPASGLVEIGWTTYNGLLTPDARWRSVVGHEIGHQLALNMWGYPLPDYYATPSAAAACNCDVVEDPDDRLHCIGSLEYSAAARAEGWAHSQSTNLVNLATDASAPFGYYKRQVDPTQGTLYPPFTVNGRQVFNWLESYCYAPTVGTEVDWFAFFYTLDNVAPNAFTIGNFWNVFQREYALYCGGAPCNSVTWNTLQVAAADFFPLGSPKAANLVTTGGLFGIDH